MMKESQEEQPVDDSALGEEQPVDESALGQSIAIRFKNKMGMVTSNQDLVFQASPGDSTEIEWTVKN